MHQKSVFIIHILYRYHIGTIAVDPLTSYGILLGILCLEMIMIDEAFKEGIVITVDRSKKPYTLKITSGQGDPASGEIDETEQMLHTGFATFPDENNKKYQFWYYPSEGSIYWDGKRGTTEDIWRKPPPSNGKYQNELAIIESRLHIFIIGNSDWSFFYLNS